MNNLLSYHSDPAVKEKYVARMKAHMVADELFQGIGFETEDGKTRGCAVGCTLDKYDHKAYETELGIPRILARLEDRIFEGLSVEHAKDFPLAFLMAITPGKDLNNVWRKLFIWMLVDEKDGVLKYAKTDSGKKAIQDVANLLERSLTEKITTQQFRNVRDAAREARRAAAAAYAAADAAAAYAAAADAAYAAADAAAAAAYAYAAYAAARKNYYKKMADKLIELLHAA